MQNSYDVLILGAGHAGIEAALAAARLGCKTLLLTMHLDAIGNMPCNPAIGGTSKGHLVREIDALGGAMGLAADACTLQARMLNLSKGAAVQSPRAQIDRRSYSERMKHTLELQENLFLLQAEAEDLKMAPNGWQITARTGSIYTAKAAVIATGTYLDSQIHIGSHSHPSGPDNLPPAVGLAHSLRGLGLPLRRFKTGTPPRINARSVDFSQTEIQTGDAEAVCFSFLNELSPPRQTLACYLTHTGLETKSVILSNLSSSAQFSGQIQGIGPRYCPSIEDKMYRFPDKESHSLFLEPCGSNTNELYLQGMSTSLPEKVQAAFICTIPGLQNAEILRYAYAIEYTCVDPLAMKPTMELIDYPGLFGAGQFCGSSGYEEAAAQGIIAGINAARYVRGEGAFILPRSSSYIGTLVDDLTNKGTDEPYRMMTSRSEYRLLLRHDTADRRLTPLGHELGLVSDERWNRFLEKQAQIESAAKTEQCSLPSPYRHTMEADKQYAGYLRRGEQQRRDMERHETMTLTPDLEYRRIPSLRTEAIQKLERHRPSTVGAAARISGVNPADITALLVYLTSKARQANIPDNSVNSR
ncbi:MAG: tRNA uridine-5-carboxymethylaminomethyl(34) synthesis enzyme MnmG [Oscillospiraceae bacterium]|jgi:tRNA uridine 5-carboxymethylaminomethyl modification enzyme|nr:tRNA uridine-5-carboxymethylaminomethyl(34) synthesis enzyme MnmG [Oscillospiraceae bacterium]